MPNGKMSDRDYLIQIHTNQKTLENQMEKVEGKLDKHLEGGNCSVQREVTEYKKNMKGTINTIWLFVISIPVFLGLVITLITLWKG